MFAAATGVSRDTLYAILLTMGKMNISPKKIIYLDQFAVSDMVESIHGSIWIKIKEKLISLHQQGKIFCPLSVEHYFETSQKNFEAAKVHDAFFTKISDGYCIKPELFITSQLISSRLRSNKTTLKTYMYEITESNLQSKEKYEVFDTQNKKLQHLVTEASAGVNKLRQSTNNQKMDNKTKESMLNTIKKIQPRQFIDRLKDLQKNGNIVIKGDIIGSEEIPNWIDLTIDQLLKKHKLNKKEVDKLILEFEKFGFDNIPTLDVKFKLMALMSVYSKGEKPGDHVDLMRIANGLPISDYLFTDKKRKAEILESKMHEKYNTKVFSGTPTDLNAFLEEINTI